MGKDAPARRPRSGKLSDRKRNRRVVKSLLSGRVGPGPLPQEASLRPAEEIFSARISRKGSALPRLVGRIVVGW